MSYKLIVASAHKTGLPDKSVHCIITSPPYKSLRKYEGNQEVDWQEMSYSPMAGIPPITIPAQRVALGAEDDIFAYIGHLLLCLRHWHDILRDDGCAFVNLGDSFTGSGGAHTHDHANPGISNSAHRDGATQYRKDGGRGKDKKISGLPAKNLMMVPARFALAAQADGWIVRNDIIWAKPNPMPESVTDRCTKAHEYIFMLTKQENYYYDAEAIKEPAQEWTGQAATFARTGLVSQHIIPGQSAAVHRPDRIDKQAGHGRRHVGFNERWDSKEQAATRNKRSVWTIATQPYEGAHFACFPAALPEICIRSSTSEKGCCPHCGKQWRRCVEKESLKRNELPKDHPSYRPHLYTNGKAGDPQMPGPAQGFVFSTTTGWAPSCSCPAHDPIPATILDPFVGSGTTCMVAQWLGRNSIGLDLSDEYHALAHERINTPREKIEDKRAPHPELQRGLFEEIAEELYVEHLVNQKTYHDSPLTA